jgi:hypothetical protein
MTFLRTNDDKFMENQNRPDNTFQDNSLQVMSYMGSSQAIEHVGMELVALPT